jgi:isoquinoline 1-oxidoreductase alpha subunit
MIQFHLNDQPVSFDGDKDTPLLWVLRDHLGMKGTKFGCGMGSCGACMVHLDGRAKKSCTTKIDKVAGKRITTIEGLASPDGTLHPVQQAWIDEDVPQCGYCQAGQIMSAVDLLNQNPVPDDEVIANQMNNLCRCGTYVRIRKAVHRASQLISQGG